MKRNLLISLFCASFIAFGAISPLVLAPENAIAQTVSLSTQATEIYAGMPFIISVSAADFDESPQPEINTFDILNAQNQPDADIHLLGVSPQISSMTTIINGKMTHKKDVKFTFNFQVTPKHEGTYTIPEITVSQGSKSASTRKVTFTTKQIGTTQDMKIELKIPDRKFWVGETIEATLILYLRKEIGERTFNVPILQMPEYFDIQEPNNIRNQMRMQGIILNVGSRQVAYPYTTDNVMLSGVQYDRVQIPIRMTPLKSGVINIPASSVYAELATGVKQDFWGFGERTYQRFKAEDKDRTCEIMALPLSNKPDSFANAMGSDFSIEVKADRTILKAGDPIILTIDITSPDALDGLILPQLNAAGLNEQLFGVSNEDPVGENIDGGPKRNIRRFSVPVRVKSDRVTEVPPIAFSYFNPKTGEYSTIRSQPIALSVSAVDKISAADILAANQASPNAENNNAAPAPQAPTEAAPAAGTLELSLISTPQSLNTSHSTSYVSQIRIALYALPFLLWAGLIGVRRIRKSRKTFEVQRNACNALKTALNNANSKDARDAAADISNALDVLLTQTETPNEPFEEIREQMEIEAYKPNSKGISDDVKNNLVECIKKNVNPIYTHLVSSILAILCAIAFCWIPSNSAYAQETSDEAMLSKAADTYHQAMNLEDRSARTAAFKQSFMMFDSLAAKYPESVELEVDAGNAALNAADFGHAALAYKRALRLDPSQTQAQNNLAYIQSIRGDSTREPSRIISDAFFLDSIPQETRLLIAAILFALGMLLIIPWVPEHKRLMRWLAVLPLAGWMWLMAGIYASANQDDEAIVLTETYLKTADNPGASNTSSNALLPGYTVSILKTNGEWMQVKTLNGTSGWLNSTSIERVDRDY